MITDFLVVIMTRQLKGQLSFYQNLLDLDIVFDNGDTLGLGRGEQLYVVLREDNTADSHHLADHKGPQILTFKCDDTIENMVAKLETQNFKVRTRLPLPDYDCEYLFVEDFDGNEICLDFVLTAK